MHFHELGQRIKLDACSNLLNGCPTCPTSPTCPTCPKMEFDERTNGESVGLCGFSVSSHATCTTIEKENKNNEKGQRLPRATHAVRNKEGVRIRGPGPKRKCPSNSHRMTVLELV
jgi:hypothetical protein